MTWIHFFSNSDSAEISLYEKLIKENDLEKERKLSMIDMTSRLQDSLKIGGSETSSPESSRDSMRQTHESVRQTRDNLRRKDGDSKCVKVEGIQNNDKGRVEHVVPSTHDGYNDVIFIPTFDDEVCFSNLPCQQDIKICEKEPNYVSVQENGHEPNDQKLCENEHKFLDDLDNETVFQVLRKADTVLLFDDKENEGDYNFDFTVPLFQTRPSCEGHEAKLSWDENLPRYCEEFQKYLGENNTNPLEDEDEGFVDLKNIATSDLINAGPFLMTSRFPADHEDLSRMQGTFTCSVCATNLEVDPFKSMQNDGVFSLSSFNGSFVPRSHDCDVTLYCPTCCSDRTVFNANSNRLLV